jgi:hypothetical protein
MLNKGEREAIIRLREEGYSYRAIREELGRYSTDTIMRVCKEEKERKIIENEERQRESEKVEENEVQKEEMYSGSVEGKIRLMVGDIKDFLKIKQLETEKREELEKILDRFQGMLRLEVDGRIPIEIEKALEENDDMWRAYIKSDYVEKKDVTPLNDKIKILETTIVRLSYAVLEKDGLISNYQTEISQLKNSKQGEIEDLNNQIECLLVKIDSLNKEKEGQQNIFENRQNYMINWQKNLEYREEVLRSNNIDSDKHEEAMWQLLDKLFFDLAEKEKTVEMGKENIKKEKEEIQKREDELKIGTEQLLKERANINKKDEEQKIKEQQLQKWQSLLEKVSGEPVRQSGESLIMHTGGQTIKVEPNIEPEISSESPSIISGDKVKVIKYSGEPTLQSGHITSYFGAGNFNKK